MHICLLFTADTSPKRKIQIQIQVFLRGFQLPDSYVWFLVRSQICRLLIKILSLIIGLLRNLTKFLGIVVTFQHFPMDHCHPNFESKFLKKKVASLIHRILPVWAQLHVPRLLHPLKVRV